MQIILASASPRRAELLQQLGATFTVKPADIDETPGENETPHDYVMRMAVEKAKSVYDTQKATNLLVIGSDTSVVCNGQIFGKPADAEHAAAMLQALSGQTHQVMSAVAIFYNDEVKQRISVSEVTFSRLSNDMIEWYWQTGEPRGKAGAYAIQGLAAKFIQHLSGSYSGVMGLPLFETAELLTEYGYDTDYAPRDSN